MLTCRAEMCILKFCS